jgi:hypothetical protein
MTKGKLSRAEIATAFDLARLGMDAWVVMGLRMAKLAAGGPAAAFEAQRMVVEKGVAAVETQMAAALALAGGASHAAVNRKTVRRYRARVAANRRRLKRR